MRSSVAFFSLLVACTVPAGPRDDAASGPVDASFAIDTCMPAAPPAPDPMRCPIAPCAAGSICMEHLGILEDADVFCGRPCIGDCDCVGDEVCRHVGGKLRFRACRPF